ncbi:hypothetical protein DPMN_077430 [Dreissena polymorpha]|nr:hypothetical protein DPMN_077430 [Dreissena polymorpha]
MCNDVGNDYDTATGALPCMHKSVLGDDSDYNHINAASNYTQNRLNSSKDTPNIDYDVINGTKFTLHSADNAGYHHVEKKSSG